jgi:hypothetical protein
MNNIQDILEEVATSLDRKIPSELREKLKSKGYRQELFDSVGRTAFLDPDNQKFPVKDEKGKYICQLIYAAYLRAKMNIGRKNNVPDSYYQSISQKAKILFKSNKCDESMRITLHEGDDLDCVSFFELFDLSNIKNNELFRYIED